MGAVWEIASCALWGLGLGAAFLVFSGGVKCLCKFYLKRRKPHDDQ